MKKLFVMVLGSVFLMANTATADTNHHKCLVLYKKAGNQAGRNVCREGWRHSNGKVTPATHNQEAKMVKKLRVILTPPPLVPVKQLNQASTSSTPTVTSGASGPSSGGYCGAYQFDQSTWNSVGGTGSPCGASPAEQDKRAQILQSERGNQPWPVCGQGGASLAQIRQCENGGKY